MSLKINMQECQLAKDAQENLIVRTRVPQSEITVEEVAAKARAWRLGAGDRVIVQCMNHERTAVLHEAEFLVRSAITKMVSVTKDDSTEQSTEKLEVEIVQWLPWRDAATGTVMAEEKPKAKSTKAAA